MHIYTHSHTHKYTFIFRLPIIIIQDIFNTLQRIFFNFNKYLLFLLQNFKVIDELNKDLFKFVCLINNRIRTYSPGVLFI